MNVLNLKLNKIAANSELANTIAAFTDDDALIAAAYQAAGFGLAGKAAEGSVWQGIAARAILVQNAHASRSDRIDAFHGIVSALCDKAKENAGLRFIELANLAAGVTTKTGKNGDVTSVEQIIRKTCATLNNYKSRVGMAWDAKLDVQGDTIDGTDATLPETLNSLNKRIKESAKPSDAADAKFAHAATAFRTNVVSQFGGCTQEQNEKAQAFLLQASSFLIAYRKGLVTDEAIEATTLELSLATQTEGDLPGEDATESEQADDRGIARAA